MKERAYHALGEAYTIGKTEGYLSKLKDETQNNLFDTYAGDGPSPHPPKSQPTRRNELPTTNKTTPQVHAAGPRLPATGEDGPRGECSD